MAATAELLKELAQISLTAEEQKKEIESFKIKYPDITPEEAYRAMGMRLDLAEKKRSQNDRCKTWKYKHGKDRAGA